MNYLVTLSYDGSQFHGWAKQINTRTVQGVIEDLLLQIFKKPVTIYGSGRTDAHVHALEQTFSFRIKKKIVSPNALLKILNNLSPSDIHFLKIKKVNDLFNARFSAKNKTYLYVISSKYDLFKSNYEFFYGKKINLNFWKKASKLFVGEHDFASFSTSKLPNTIRKINFMKFKKTKANILIYINANGFLRSMVRMIVGSLIDLNEKTKSVDDIKKLIAYPNKGSAINKARACGLYLLKVKY